MEGENVNPWKLQIEQMQKDFKVDVTGVKNEPSDDIDEPWTNDDFPSQDVSFAMKQEHAEPEVTEDTTQVAAKTVEKAEYRGPFQCDICKETIEISVVASHFNGKAHRRKMELMFMEKSVKKEKCDLCGTTYQSLVQVFDHLNGFDHAVKLVASKPNRANRSIPGMSSILEGRNAFSGRGGSIRGASGGGRGKRGGSANTHVRGSGIRGQSNGGYSSRGRGGGAGRGGVKIQESSWGGNPTTKSILQTNSTSFRGRGAGRGSSQNHESNWGSNAAPKNILQTTSTSFRGRRGAGRGSSQNNAGSWGSNATTESILQTNLTSFRGRGTGRASYNNTTENILQTNLTSFRGRGRGRASYNNTTESIQQTNLTTAFRGRGRGRLSRGGMRGGQGGGKMMSHNWQPNRVTPYGDSSYGGQLQEQIWDENQFGTGDNYLPWNSW